MKTLITLAAWALAAPAMALTFNGAQTQGATVASDFSSTGLVAFDIDFASAAPATLSYTVSADDLNMPLGMNAVLRNLTGLGVGGYSLLLTPGSFATVGTVNRPFGGSTQVQAQGASALLLFSSPESFDVEIGNALGSTPGAIDWTLGGLQAGDSFSITVSAVPEPATYAMWLAGLLGMGFVATRRQR